MTQAEKCNELRERIDKELVQIIGKRCVLLGVPHYLNIGDVLIWDGTRQFLKANGIKCLYTASKESFRFKPYPEDVTVLLQGGGNFGDLWPEEHMFRREIIRHYPNNRIVVLPQTVHYLKEETINADRTLFAQHQNIFICARDNISYQSLAGIINTDKIKLVPDMAFAMTASTGIVKGNKDLLIIRHDKELKGIPVSFNLSETTKASDWPTFEPEIIPFAARVFRYLFAHLRTCPMFTDYLADFLFRPYMVSLGKRFLSQYGRIYTTRLHGCILSILLSKQVTLFDNSYGKNSSFFNTWLKDSENVDLML